MTRALIVGPRDGLAAAVDALYGLKLLHLVDHQAGQEDLEIGAPLATAAQASEVLVKLRSIANVLQVEEPKATDALEPVSEDVREKILSLELNISEEDASRKKVQSLLQDLGRKIEEITPFAQLPLRLEDYRGYDSLDVLVGRVPREVDGLETVTPDMDAFQTPGFLAVAVAKDKATAMREFLGQHGFTAVPIPEGQGHPRENLAELLAEKERWEKRASEIDERLTSLRERYSGFLAAAKAHLEVEVEKAEAPLRFAVTEHTFIVEGWVPSETFPTMKAELEKLPDMFVSELETQHEAHEEPAPAAEPPVLLKNPRLLRPFEMLVKMFGTPTYTEIDPTPVLFLAFPMMFGIMVGDAGYGVAWMAYGVWLLRRWKTRPWDFWKNLLVAFIWGGFWATVFGLFVFGEAFGIPFHAPVGATSRAELFNWSDNILHANIPLYPILEKLHQVADFIVLALAASFIHLGTGFVIGFFDELKHSKKHALGKVAWLMVLVGIFTVIMARAARWPVVDGRETFGYLIWTGPLGWFPKDGLTSLAGFDLTSVGFTAANPLPTASLVLLLVGVVILLAVEGGLHIMEVFSLVANTVSYARLAGIGVAEEAVIFALNVIALDFMIFPWIDSGNVAGLIGGLVVMALANLMLFILSTISGTIQSIRLHYVEFFLKFYKGAGTSFRPFGVKAQPEV